MKKTIEITICDWAHCENNGSTRCAACGCDVCDSHLRDNQYVCEGSTGAMLSLQVLVCPACFSDEITANIARDRLQQILADAWSRPFADKTKKADQPSVVKRCERDRLVDIFGTAYATLLALRANSLPELGVPWCIISSNLDSLHDLLTSLDKDAPARFEKELPKA